MILVFKLETGPSLLSKYWANDLSLDINLPRFFTLLSVDFVFWLLVGLAFHVLVGAVQPVSTRLILPFAGAFSAAWVAGFLAFVTPGGLGVREGVLAILLAPLLPVPLPAVIALLARLWWTGAELLSILLASVAVKLISTDLEGGNSPFSNH